MDLYLIGLIIGVLGICFEIYSNVSRSSGDDTAKQDGGGGGGGGKKRNKKQRPRRI